MSYALQQSHSQRRPVDSAVTGSTTARRRFFTKTYVFIFFCIAGLAAVSPTLGLISREWNHIDRPIDGLMILLGFARVVEISFFEKRIPKNLTLIFVFILGYFFVSASVLALADQFSTTLFIIEGKILLLLSLLLLFQHRTLEGHSRLILRVFLTAFVLAFLFWVVLGTGRRFGVINESNYAMLAYSLLVYTFIRVEKIRPLSRGWLLLVLISTLLVIGSQSRTGLLLATVALFSPFLYERLTVLRLYFYGAFIILMTYFIFEISPILVPRMAHLADFASVDRFIFLQNYLRVTAEQGPLAFILGGNVGNVVSNDLGTMQWWSLKQITKFSHELGIAPFHFHSGFLRLLSAHGLIFSGVIIFFIYRSLGRKNIVAMVLLLLAGISMSSLHLSAVIPFIVLTQMAHQYRTASTAGMQRKSSLPRN